VVEERGFRPARLAGRESVGGGLTRVTVEPSEALLSTYRRPGQYVEMRVDGAMGFFVLASDPGEGPWTLIMRPGGGASDVVLGIAIGSPIELTGALGHGFPADAAAGLPLVIALNGTGVAAAPPLVHRRIRDGDAGLTQLYIGLRTRDELPIEPELRAFRQGGVEVVVCLSQAPALVAEDSEEAVTRFAPGYVQDVLRARVTAGSLSGGRIFAVGSSAMLASLRDVALDLGLPRDHVHTNY
jgi:NAD(P)H-flavin reductase